MCYDFVAENSERGTTLMRAAEGDNRDGSEVLILDRDGLLRLIGEEAKRLGLTAEEALDRIEHSAGGDSYVWFNISLLAGLLKQAP